MGCCSLLGASVAPSLLRGASLRLAPEALLDVVDAGLERGDAVPQLGEVALENLAPARLVDESCLDPPQGLDDSLVLLLEPLEPLVVLVEVPEHLVSELGEPAVDFLESAIDHVEPTVDLGELASQELDELPVFGRGHDPSLSQVGGPFKRIQWWAADAQCIVRRRRASGRTTSLGRAEIRLTGGPGLPSTIGAGARIARWLDRSGIVSRSSPA